MSTLIGSDQTNISFQDGLFKFTVDGNDYMQIITDPNVVGGVGTYATVEYVNDRTINDLANQDGNYNAQGFKFTNIATATDPNDMVNK